MCRLFKVFEVILISTFPMYRPELLEFTELTFSFHKILFVVASFLSLVSSTLLYL
jgi:hypothetical protein